MAGSRTGAATAVYALYLVTDEGLSRGRSQEAIVRAAIAGGVTMVQYRRKEGATRLLIEEASVLLSACRAARVPFIVNDRIDVALAVGADGVHVGQDDMPAALARRLVGTGMILGVSAGSAAEARAAEKDGADYIGASPVFATPTKPDAPPPLGVEGLRAVCAAVRIPVVAIGGMNEANAAAMRQAGASGVAVISAIVGAQDVEAAARAIRTAFDKARVQ
jgi:thiamine-phosphate pyrophosphorylase